MAEKFSNDWYRGLPFYNEIAEATENPLVKAHRREGMSAIRKVLDELDDEEARSLSLLAPQEDAEA